MTDELPSCPGPRKPPRIHLPNILIYKILLFFNIKKKTRKVLTIIIYYRYNSNTKMWKFEAVT